MAGRLAPGFGKVVALWRRSESRKIHVFIWLIIYDWFILSWSLQICKWYKTCQSPCNFEWANWPKSLSLLLSRMKWIHIGPYWTYLFLMCVTQALNDRSVSPCLHLMLQSLLSWLAFTEVDHGFHVAWLFWTSNSFGMLLLTSCWWGYNSKAVLKLKYLVINWHKAKISIGFAYIFIYI